MNGFHNRQQEIIHKCSEGNSLLAVHALPTTERTVETTQLALQFGGSREWLLAIKSGESS